MAMIDRQDVLNIAGSGIALGLVSILGFMAWALVYVAIPADNREPLLMLLGILSTQVGIVVGFYFGSSSQAKKQAETIDKLADTAKTTAETAHNVHTIASPMPDVSLKSGQTVTVEATDGKP